MRLMKRATTRKAAKLTSRRATTGSTEPKRESGMVGEALSADEVAIRPSVARSARRTARTARADRGVALAGPTAVNTLDPEAAARQYLDRALAGETRKTLARPESGSGRRPTRSRSTDRS